MFGFHYTNRTLVFPLLIRGGKPTPFVYNDFDIILDPFLRLS